MSTGLNSAAFVEEALEADPQGVDDTVSMEQSNRKVAPQAVLVEDSDTGDGKWIQSQAVYMPFREIPEGSGLEL